MALDWLAGTSRRLRQLLSGLAARGVAQDQIEGALQAAYWAAQHAAIPHVVSGQRRALTRQYRALARLDEAVTAVLDLEEPVAVDLAGHLHVARALARTAATQLAAPPAPARPGRPAGWRLEAEQTLAGLGIRRHESRPLLQAVAALVSRRPVCPREVPYLRVAYRLRQPDRGRVLLRLLPPGGKPSGPKLFPAVAAPHTSRG